MTTNTDPRPPIPRFTDEQIIQRAEEALDDLCSGKRRWTMTVPPDDKDQDMRFSDLIAYTRARQFYNERNLPQPYYDLLDEVVAEAAQGAAPRAEGLDVQEVARIVHDIWPVPGCTAIVHDHNWGPESFYGSFAERLVARLRPSDERVPESEEPR